MLFCFYKSNNNILFLRDKDIHITSNQLIHSMLYSMSQCCINSQCCRVKKKLKRSNLAQPEGQF